ncbi:hypothetical protein FOZ61_004863, partial [Perkinsus olseni]
TSSLQSSLGTLFFLVTYLYISGFWSLYVDDGILSGSVRHLVYNLTVLVYVMLLCGFAVQLAKFACICEPSHAAELKRLDRVYKFACSDTIYQLSKSAAFSYAGALS